MKTSIFILLLFFMVSCGETCNTSQCIEAKAKLLQTESKIQAEALEKKRAYELEKAKIEASRPAEVIKQEQQSEANDSLEYLENSQKARDVIEWAVIWYWIFKILTD